MASFKNTKMNPDRFHRSQIKFFIILLPVVLFMLLPIVYIFSTAFKPADELFLFPPRFLVQKPTLDNFKKIMEVSSTGVPLSRYIFNSVIITSVVLISSVVFSAMAGYALSKLKFKGKKVWFEVNQLALMFIASAIAIPKYLIIERMGLIDTIWANVLPILAIPVGLFLVKQFIDQVPDELIEAARIDGAGEFTIFFMIILPIIKPAVATIAILSFQIVWNDASTSTTYINNESLRTLAFYMSSLSASGGTSVAGAGISAATSLVMFLPNLIVFIILQSKIMNTVAHSGMK